MPGVDFLQAGVYAPVCGPFGQMGSIGLTASRCYYVRFVAPKTMTITKIAFYLSVAASVDDPCDVGIYSSAAPPVLLASSGSQSGLLNSAPGPKTVTLSAPVQLVAGQVYYAAFACGVVGGTAASAVMTSTGGPQLFAMFGANPPNSEQTFQASTFPLPATAAVGGPVTSAPILAMVQ